MSLPAEVLPQLLHGSALSGQPEAQRGLWLLCEGTGGNFNVHAQRSRQHAAKHEGTHSDTAVSLHTLLLPIPHFLYVITKHHDQFFNPSDLLLLPALPLPRPLLFSPQWCERNEQCRRLQLRDLLVAPLQRLTRYPLLLRNIAKRCQTEDETRGLQATAEQVDTSICEKQTHYTLFLI